jgi:TonB family protein
VSDHTARAEYVVSIVFMTCLGLCTELSLAIVAIAVPVQMKPTADQKYEVCCNPTAIANKPRPTIQVRLRKDEKWVGAPVIAYQVLESGRVVNIYVKRSSGVADLDAFAARSIRATKYNKRRGCGTVEAEATVNIDF